MTKNQAKQFAKIFVGQQFYAYNFFDKNQIEAPDEDKDLIKAEINSLLCRMLGAYGCLDPQDIYNIVTYQQ